MAKAQQAAQILEHLDTAEEGPIDADRIRDWLVTYLTRLLELPPESVSTDATFQSFGLDSAAAVGLTGDLGRWLGSKLEPTLAYDYPTIDTLSEHLASALPSRG